ncbi:hypothetical protein ACFODZ_03325 [Marinicella sediminis]|uniref:Uncharacterized protein n=1 Tax=Marinicella sediminis TaxID=1792834 RepID=A0ABV7JAK1_9GAMM|nr:hypothetical protein [Marinicella sediminis]
MHKQSVITIMGLHLLIFSQTVHGVGLHPGLNGSWHNPEQNGQGLVIHIAPANNLLFAAWFTYSEAGGQQQWLTAYGDLSSQPVNLTLTSSTGGGLNVSDPTPQQSVWGSGQLTFHDCISATFQFSGSSEGQIELTRITPPINCIEDQP